MEGEDVDYDIVLVTVAVVVIPFILVHGVKVDIMKSASSPF